MRCRDCREFFTVARGPGPKALRCPNCTRARKTQQAAARMQRYRARQRGEEPPEQPQVVERSSVERNGHITTQYRLADLEAERSSGVDPIAQRYWAWRATEAGNRTYALCARFARELRDHGCEHYGITALLERVRWHVEVEERQHCRVNNAFGALLARELMDEQVVPEGFFTVRRRRLRQ